MKVDKEPSKFVPNDPYQQMALSGISAPGHFGVVWKVTPSELWYFDGFGTLFSVDARGDTRKISPEHHWMGNASEGGCSGQLSVSEPRLFLAMCRGVLFYTDGYLDSLFQYWRTAVFDVSSKKLLARFSGGGQKALSPSGGVVAVEDKDEVRLYRIH